MGSDDRDVERWLRYFTFFPVAQIAEVMAEHGRDPGKRTAQRRLAEEMTTRIHGAETTRSVVEATRLLFGGGDLRAAGAGAFAVLAQEIPTARVPRPELEGLTAADALVKAGLASSKGDARRGIAGKGFSLNGEALAAADRRLAAGDLLAGKYLLLQKGKKSYALLLAE
jgi:tyrosyl-tRNA synthetase